MEPIANVILAQGQTRLLFRSNLTVSIVELLLLYPAMRYFGIEGVAILVSLSYALQYFIYFPYMKKRYGLNYRLVWESIRAAILTGIIVAVIMSVCELYLKYSVVSLMIKIVLISFMYILLYGVFTKWRMYLEIKSLIVEKSAV